MKSLFAPPDPEYDLQCYKKRFFNIKRQFAELGYDLNLSWEKSGQFLSPTERLVLDIVLRRKRRPVFEEFKLCFYPGVRNYLLEINSRPLDLITVTREVWGKRLNRTISNEEAIKIMGPFRNLLSLMREIRANGQ